MGSMLAVGSCSFVAVVGSGKLRDGRFLLDLQAQRVSEVGVGAR